MKAIVIGATGLVGKAIVEQLLKDPAVDNVLLFVRRTTGLIDKKLHETLVDFDHMETWQQEIQGDVLFSALGTTLKAAGSKEAQYKVDHDYQFQVAARASMNGVKNYVLISSVNADSKSSFFYLKMKGELEKKVMNLPFSSINILQPGPLKGHRETSRLNEVISTRLLDMLPKVLISAGIKPVAGAKVAGVAIRAGLTGKKGVNIIGPALILND